MNWKKSLPPRPGDVKIIKKFCWFPKTLPAKDTKTGNLYLETKFLEYGFLMQKYDYAVGGPRWINLGWSKHNEEKEKQGTKPDLCRWNDYDLRKKGFFDQRIVDFEKYSKK